MSMNAAIQSIRKTVNRTDMAPYRMVNVSWEDASRTMGSCWGKNITDVRRLLLERTRDGGCREHVLPCIRRNNYEHTKGDLIRVKAGALSIVTGNHPLDAKSGTLRPVTLSSYIRDLHNHASSVVRKSPRGPMVPDGANEEVYVRLQAVILPMNNGSAHDVRGMRDGEAEFVDVMYNYNTKRADRPRNLVLLCSPQGCSVSTSNYGAHKMHQQVCVDGVMRDATTLVAASEHKVEEVGQIETEKERKDAEKNGYGTAMYIGVKGMGRSFNVSMSVQIPLLQRQERRGGERHRDLDFCARKFCKKSLSWHPSKDNYSILRQNQESCRGRGRGIKSIRRRSARVAPSSPAPPINISCGRVSYGTIGKASNVISQTLERDTSQKLTATISIMYTVRDPSAFTSKDVEQIIKNLDKISEMLQDATNTPGLDTRIPGTHDESAATSWAEVGTDRHHPTFVADHLASFPTDDA